MVIVSVGWGKVIRFTSNIKLCVMCTDLRERIGEGERL